MNYHEGSLPAYRGLMVTSFSILAGDAESGFTFHRMTEALDAGPVVVRGAVTSGACASLEPVRRRKIAAAVAALPHALERLVAADAGTPQTGPARYYSSSEAAALSRLGHPELFTVREIEARVRAFGTVRITIGGRDYPVTRLRPARRGDRLTFAAANGRRLAVDRLDRLPLALWRG
jgi:methionyl-tRNA formyltransferase